VSLANRVTSKEKRRAFRHLSIGVYLVILLAAPASFSLTVPDTLLARSRHQARFLQGGHWTNEREPASPDPAFAYRWSKQPRGDSPLQILQLRPKSAKFQPNTPMRTTGALTDSVVLDRAQSIFLDFGTECAGWVSFETSEDVRDNLTVSVSEYSTPGRVNGGPKHPEKTVVPELRDGVWIAAMNDELYEGVRFAWLNVDHPPSKPIQVRNIRLNCRVKPVAYEGSFHSSDEFLNRIWYTAAYTARLNMQENTLSALLMDRGDRISWTGDAFVTQRTVLSAFASSDLVRANLESNRQNSNGIEPYTLLWIQSVVDYFEFTGDQVTLNHFMPDVQTKLKHAEDIWDDPDIFFYGHDERLGFLQTPPANLPEEKNAYRLLVIRELRQVANSAKQVGEVAESEELLVRASDLEARFFRRCPGWVSELGLHAAAEAILAKVGTDTEREQLSRRVFENPEQRISFSPFNEYQLLEALAKQGRTQDALTDLKTLWGAQIRYGATCFAEVFRPSWADDIPTNGKIPDGVVGYTSLCHGWSSGAAPWVQEHVLGVDLTSIASQELDVSPLLEGGPDRFAGDVATPAGPVHVSWNASIKQLWLKWPAKYKVILVLPADIQVSGAVRRSTSASFNSKDSATYFPVGTVTELELRITHPPFPLSDKLPQPSWPNVMNIAKAQPQGNWKGVYGQEGHWFFGLPDIQGKLPQYVSAIKIRSPEAVVWANKTDDPRALETSEGDGRVLGAITTKLPDWDKLTTAVDVSFSNNLSHRVTLYFVDWELEDREVEVNLTSLIDGTPLARSLILRHFGNGLYISFDIRSSFRIRVAHVDGGGACISAMFFDPVPKGVPLR